MWEKEGNIPPNHEIKVDLCLPELFAKTIMKC